MQRRLIDKLNIKKRSISPIPRRGENDSRIRNVGKSKSVIRKAGKKIANTGPVKPSDGKLNSLPLIGETKSVKRPSQRLKLSKKSLKTEKNKLADSKTSTNSKINNLNIDIKKKNLSKRDSSVTAITIKMDSEFKSSGSFMQRKQNLESLELGQSGAQLVQDNNKRSHHVNLGFPETEKVKLNEKAKSMTQIDKLDPTKLKHSLNIKKKTLRSKTPIKSRD